MERERLLAYNIAALTGSAFVGKLRRFADVFPEPEIRQTPREGMTPESAALLGAMFRLQQGGVEMTVEKISLH